MPKRRTSRKKRSRVAAPSVAAPAARAVAPTMAMASPGAKPAEERTVARPATRDYGYVRLELQRIAALAIAILLVIVVLSFFLP